MESTCTSCLKQNPQLTCELCSAPVCKSCTQHLHIEEGLNFLRERPVELTHEMFCPACFDSKVMPKLEAFREIMARARDVNVFYKSQSKESRFVRRTEKPVKVDDCPDKDEAVLRLAFRAAEAGFNALLDVDLDARKVFHGRWQSSVWFGSAVPARIDQKKLDRRFINTPN